MAISMDGRGRALDNVFIERLWRTIKYEEVYLKDYADGWHAEQSLTNYFRFYCHQRVHQSLDYRTPVAPSRENGSRGGGGTKQHQPRKKGNLKRNPTLNSATAAAKTFEGSCGPLVKVHYILSKALQRPKVGVHLTPRMTDLFSPAVSLLAYAQSL